MLSVMSPCFFKEYADGLRQQLVALGVTEFNSERAERTLASIEMEDPDVQHSDVEPSIQNLRQIFLDVGQ